MRKRLELIVEKGNNEELWGRIYYGDDLVTSVGTSLQELINNFKVLFQDLYGLSKSKIKVDIKYDLEAFFETHEELNISAIAKRAGINRALLQQYKSGSKYPSANQVKKIEKVIHQLAKELQEIELLAA